MVNFLLEVIAVHDERRQKKYLKFTKEKVERIHILKVWIDL